MHGAGSCEEVGTNIGEQVLVDTENREVQCMPRLFYFISFHFTSFYFILFYFLWKYNLYVEKWSWEYSLRNFYKLNTSGVTGTHNKKWCITGPQKNSCAVRSNYPTYPRGATILTSNSKSTFDYFLTLYYWLLLFSSLYVRFVNVCEL